MDKGKPMFYQIYYFNLLTRLKTECSTSKIHQTEVHYKTTAKIDLKCVCNHLTQNFHVFEPFEIIQWLLFDQQNILFLKLLNSISQIYKYSALLP